MIKIERKKLRKLSKTTNPFLSLARSIIYQQISTKAGDSIYKKFSDLFKGKTPTPEILIKISESKLRAAGLSSQKSKYLHDLSRKFLNKTIDPSGFDRMSDEEIREHLIQVKGIGMWTADMFLIFALNRKNVLPTGDLGIRKGFMRAFNLRKLPDHSKMVKLARAFNGKHTELSLHLWFLLDGK
ncbi:DNA-3-methyladenine glycosylase 2 family protein [Candidatus Parcubacteria bacterium]|nr:DNA-3-methyladenine glycosylase 2 family protein [Candidatus Parcubacteria bacterium]